MLSCGGILGRERELAALDVAVAAALDEGAALLVVGEPGIGKSALLAAARAAAQQAGCTVLRAAGVESEVQLPFGGLHQVVAPLMHHLARVPEAQQAALATALGLAEGAPPDLFLIAEATVTLVSIERAERPVVVIVDDVHWLDPQSNQILTFLAHRGVGTGICVVAATRPDIPGPFADGGFPRLPVGGVDDATAERILSASAGVGDLTAASQRQIRQVAEGNPLALMELPRSWGEGPPAEGHPMGVSARLERAFAGRISELALGTRNALLVAAVSSSGDPAEISRALAGLGTGGPLGHHLQPAVTAGLVTDEAAAVRFRHPLVRSAVLQAETLGRRHAAHAALADVLVADTYRRTWHRAWSIVGPDDGVADALAATVPDSLRRGAVMSAVAGLERAAQLTSSPTRCGRRLVEAAVLAFGAGRADVVARILRAASRVDLADLDEIRVTWLTEALNDDVRADSALVGRLCGSARRASALGDTGLALNLLLGAALRCWWADSGADDGSAVVRVLDRLPDVSADPRHLAATAIAEPVLSGSEVLRLLGTGAADDVRDGDSLRVHGMAAYAAGDLVRATDLLDRAEESFRRDGRLGMLPVVLALQLHIRLDLGDWSGWVSASREVATVSRETGQAVFADNNVLVQARGLALRGEWRSALAAMADAEAEATRQRITDRICLAHQARGAALLSADRPAEAFGWLRRPFDPADPGHHLRESFAGVALMAEAAVGCGRMAEARAITRSLETVAVLTPSPLLEVNLLYARAVLAPDHALEDRYRAALAHDLGRWPWLRARVQLAYGRWLAQARRSSEAEVQLQAAIDVFERIGAVSWRRWTAAALTALDDPAGPPRPPGER